MKRFFALLILALLLAACGDAYTIPSGIGPIDSPSAQSAQVNTPAQAATGTFHEFALPQDKSGLMRPTIDARGRLWFGEMGHNYLGSFDPQSKSFWQGTPPSGKSGIMGIVVAPDGSIWFAEQYANYIGHFSPRSGQYRVYPLPMVSTPDASDPGHNLSLPSAPNDLALDPYGNLWFTELNTDQLGRLNIASGAIQHYPLTREKNARPLNPYGITVDPRGIVWFSEASANLLGRLDPASGQVSTFTVSITTSPLMELASDARGHIWATAFSNSLLLQFDPASQHFTAYNAPGSSSGTSSLYGLLIASNGDIWVAATAANLLARLDVQGQRFYSYAIPTANSLPMGLAEDSHHAIWFTESGSDKIGVLQP
ncbi:MAG TPA: hypothetical protein VF458_23595 [Ktedonobacteraceae bacterium]